MDPYIEDMDPYIEDMDPYMEVLLQGQMRSWHQEQLAAVPVGVSDRPQGGMDLDIPMGWALAIPRRYTHPYYPTTPGTPPPWHRTQHAVPGMGSEPDLNA